MATLVLIADATSHHRTCPLAPLPAGLAVGTVVLAASSQSGLSAVQRRALAWPLASQSTLFPAVVTELLPRGAGGVHVTIGGPAAPFHLVSDYVVCVGSGTVVSTDAAVAVHKTSPSPMPSFALSADSTGGVPPEGMEALLAACALQMQCHHSPRPLFLRRDVLRAAGAAAAILEEVLVDHGATAASSESPSPFILRPPGAELFADAFAQAPIIKADDDVELRRSLVVAVEAAPPRPEHQTDIRDFLAAVLRGESLEARDVVATALRDRGVGNLLLHCLEVLSSQTGHVAVCAPYVATSASSTAVACALSCGLLHVLARRCGSAATGSAHHTFRPLYELRAENYDGRDEGLPFDADGLTWAIADLLVENNATPTPAAAYLQHLSLRNSPALDLGILFSSCRAGTGACGSLRRLDVSRCRLPVTLTCQLIFQCTSLEDLDLSYPVLAQGGDLFSGDPADGAALLRACRRSVQTLAMRGCYLDDEATANVLHEICTGVNYRTGVFGPEGMRTGRFTSLDLADNLLGQRTCLAIGALALGRLARDGTQGPEDAASSFLPNLERLNLSNNAGLTRQGIEFLLRALSQAADPAGVPVPRLEMLDCSHASAAEVLTSAALRPLLELLVHRSRANVRAVFGPMPLRLCLTVEPAHAPAMARAVLALLKDHRSGDGHVIELRPPRVDDSAVATGSPTVIVSQTGITSAAAHNNDTSRDEGALSEPSDMLFPPHPTFAAIRSVADALSACVGPTARLRVHAHLPFVWLAAIEAQWLPRNNGDGGQEALEGLAQRVRAHVAAAMGSPSALLLLSAGDMAVAMAPATEGAADTLVLAAEHMYADVCVRLAT